jgi:hypothetical protein
MPKSSMKGCLQCRNSGWVTVVERQGEYCTKCPRGERLRRRHVYTAVAVMLLLGVLAGTGVML